MFIYLPNTCQFNHVAADLRGSVVTKRDFASVAIRATKPEAALHWFHPVKNWRSNKKQNWFIIHDELCTSCRSDFSQTDFVVESCWEEKKTKKPRWDALLFLLPFCSRQIELTTPTLTGRACVNVRPELKVKYISGAAIASERNPLKLKCGCSYLS